MSGSRWYHQNCHRPSRSRERFAYLNTCEVLGCDDWGELMSKPEAELTSADLALLDQIAALTTQADTLFEEMRALFAQTGYGQAVREQIAVLV